MLHKRHKEESKTIYIGKETLLSVPLTELIIQLKLIDVKISKNNTEGHAKYDIKH